MSDKFSIKTNGRNQYVELLRIISAYGIVVYHSGAYGHDVALSGLVIFLVISPMFEVEANWGRIRNIISLTKIFIIPWIFWLSVYALVQIARHEPIIKMENGPIAGILYGTSGHLWFMPFMFSVLAILGLVKKHIDRAPLFWVSLAISSAMLILAPFWRPWSIDLGVPFAQWIHAVPAVFMGIAIGLARGVSGGKIAIGALILSIIIAAIEGVQSVSLSYPIATVLVFGAAWLGPKLPQVKLAVEPLSRCMMGVYLVHVICLVAVRQIIGHLGLLEATFAFLVAFLGVWFARHYVPKSKIVLG